MLEFLYPWGLVSFASLGGIVYLYLHVFRGRRIEVSSLHLWDASQSMRIEGPKRRRPPITWPLVLELTAALLLSLVAAGLAANRVTERRHAVVVLDSSASMNAGRGSSGCPGRTRARLNQVFDLLGSDGRVSIVRSGGSELIGGKALSREGAAAALASWAPADPPHSFDPALELARSLAGRDGRIVLITDAEGLLGRKHEDCAMLGVGEPAENSGWIAAHWLDRGRLFALLKHFGKDKAKRTVVLESAGAELARIEVDFAARNPAPLVFEVPESVTSVTARLAGAPDGLANDDVLRMTRPQPLAVAASVAVEDKQLRAQLVKALTATGKVELTERGKPWVALDFADERSAAGAAGKLKVVFHPAPKDAARALVGPYFVNGLSEQRDLMRGVELQGVIWGADPGFRAEAAPGGPQPEPLVSAGEVPLVVAKGSTLLLNFTPDQTNLFRMPAWPVLISNIVDQVHAQSPGLKRFSFRLGESLSFRRPPQWPGKLEVRDPQGRRTAFAGDEVYYGRLERDGIYEVLLDGAPAALIDVNLLAEGESDLTARKTFGDTGSIRTASTKERETRPFHRELFLAAAALLLGAWWVLERGKL